MTGVRCRHRRPRPLVVVPFVAALVLIALGYGLVAGVAHGHADAARLYATVAEGR